MLFPASFIFISHIYLSSAACYVGTTPHIRSLLINRCLEYQMTVQPSIFCNQRRNCTLIADQFLESFRFQETCNVSSLRFGQYLELTHHDTPPNMVLFWEDVYPAVKMYSNNGRRLMPISDTFYGYLPDDVFFCATTETPGIIFNETCPNFSDTKTCPQNAEYSFWVAASQQYASSAVGKVHIMFNSSMETPFVNDSFFATWELPNINSTTVTSAEILLVHYPGQSVRSKCSGQSITELKNKLQERGITTVCHDSPRRVQLVFCGDYPDNKECLSLISSSSPNITPSLIFFSYSLLLYYYI
ncbi:ADP-ribosyl cyclase/cyclic ADP-ribose hydrolase [Patella vulgata]|uniref:ADP-ribosyl cyclase/cyclic ADP-ribose hydrolase n=1 Tax=Patella vulgata TaxID=6465 RepID=UPI00217F5050|nr:ADP-ribosyl cyclase/cyclic ADP-ribose hydrolase [Patella vulgata]